MYHIICFQLCIIITLTVNRLKESMGTSNVISSSECEVVLEGRQINQISLICIDSCMLIIHFQLRPLRFLFCFVLEVTISFHQIS